MKRIDFLGAPGVGKTTICVELLKEYSSCCISEHNAFLEALKIYLSKQNSIKSQFLKLGLFLPKLNSIISSAIINKKNIKLIDSIIKNEKFFMEKVDEVYCNSNNPYSSRKLSGYSSFIRKMQIWYFINNYFLDDKFVLSDESIPQRIFGIYGVRETTDNDLYLIEEYYKTMPLPTVLVFIESDVDKIFENVKKRYEENNLLIPGHQNVDASILKKRIKASVYITRTGYDILKDRGANVFKVDAKKTIDENSVLIMDYLRKIN